MSVQNKTHEDWFILVFGDDRQSAWLLTVWDDLQSQIGGFEVNLGTIDFNAISDLETRLKLKQSPQTLYLKAGRSYNVTLNTVEEAMLLLTDPARISTYKNRKIKLTSSWFKRMAIIWDQLILKRVEKNAFVLIGLLFGVVGVCIAIVVVTSSKILKDKLD